MTERTIIDADFEIVGGPYRVGDEHRRERGWFFTGKYNAEGHAYFMRHPRWWKRRRLLRLAYYTVWGVAGVVALTFGASYAISLISH